VRDFTRRWNLEMRKNEAECPNTFLLTGGSDNPFNPENWASRDYRLTLFCQHPQAPHQVSPGYEVRQAKAWWATMQPWFKHLRTFLKFAVPMGSAVGAVIDATDFTRQASKINLLKEVNQDIPVFADFESGNMLTPAHEGEEQQVIGSALRALYTFLKEVDPSQHWGGLRKTLTPDGNILWLCEGHRREYEEREIRL
jgi:hypothetical protein